MLFTIASSSSLLILCFQAEDGIRYLVRSRGLGDVYKRQGQTYEIPVTAENFSQVTGFQFTLHLKNMSILDINCLLYTSDAADERSSVDLGGRRIIKKKNKIAQMWNCMRKKQQ